MHNVKKLSLCVSFLNTKQLRRIISHIYYQSMPETPSHTTCSHLVPDSVLKCQCVQQHFGHSLVATLITLYHIEQSRNMLQAFSIQPLLSHFFNLSLTGVECLHNLLASRLQCLVPRKAKDESHRKREDTMMLQRLVALEDSFSFFVVVPSSFSVVSLVLRFLVVGFVESKDTKTHESR